MQALILVLLAAGSSSVQPPIGGEELQGRVVAVTDGDTVTVEAEVSGASRRYKVRLSEVDAPESKQPYGPQAKSELSALAAGQEVRLVPGKPDRYGRVLGHVSVGTMDLSTELIRRGAAWVYRQYSRDPSLVRLEGEAQAASRGLWSLPANERVPPWVWRNGPKQRAGQAAFARWPPYLLTR